MTKVRPLIGKGIQPEWPSSNDDTAITAAALVGCFTRIAATWHAAINFLVPIGYEDASGFHYGEPPSRNDRGQGASF